MPNDHPKYVTTEQAAAHLGVSPSFLEKARKAGTGPAVMRLGRAVRYTVDDLDAWAEAQRATPEPAKLLAPAPRQPRAVRIVQQRHAVSVRRKTDMPAWERIGYAARTDAGVRAFAMLASIGGIGELSAQDSDAHAMECAERAARDEADAIREDRGLTTRAYSSRVSRQQLRDIVANRYPIIDVNAQRWFRTDERFKTRTVRWVEDGLFVRVHLEDMLQHFPELLPEDIAHLRIDGQPDAS